MPFEAAVFFPGVLSDAAERYAKEVTVPMPQASIIQEMGWTATLIDEADGGYGGTFQDLASIIESLARRAISLPIMTRCAVVPAMLSAARGSTAIKQLLSKVACGEVCIDFAGPLSQRESQSLPLGRYTAGCWQLNGTLDSIESRCSHVLFNALDAATGEALVVLASISQLPPHATEYATVEGRPIQSIELHGLQLEDDAVLARGDTALAMQAAGWQIAQAAICADIVCTMNCALAETLSYLQERKQFGQALAQFQVLRHEAAKLYVSLETCKCLLMSSLRAFETAGELQQSAASFDLLGLYVREQAIEFAQCVIQLHGGMGMAQETLAARMGTRLIALALRYGDSCSHMKALGKFQTKVTQ